MKQKMMRSAGIFKAQPDVIGSPGDLHPGGAQLGGVAGRQMSHVAGAAHAVEHGLFRRNFDAAEGLGDQAVGRHARHRAHPAHPLDRV